MAEGTSVNGVASSMSNKRQGYLEWDDYFMSVAFLSAQRSKDPRTQVGACIVNEDRRIVGVGYNGMPRGCSDDDFPWCNEGVTELEKKNLYVCHAELNAILNKNSADVRNYTIYVGLFPCNECAKVIIQSGIKEVIYYSDKYEDKITSKASRIMLDHAKIKYRQYQPTNGQIVIDFTSLDEMKDRIIS
ncbi:deoxycytidylate deaminase-like [Octopus sinensis]|uniref:dCMP deaminase n=1 Tax=Octopus sinensis TaxID=2607531 RepID=A0A6P7SV36_9MOLL|nr:deoxycytidylate deaminase-like [Octopus sinensis]